MTSAHRSQLEARNGGKNNVKTNIKHSRLLPSHNTLKYRSDHKNKDLFEQGSYIELDEQDTRKAEKLIESTNQEGSAANDPDLAQRKFSQEPTILYSANGNKDQKVSNAESGISTSTSNLSHPLTNKSSWRKKAVFKKSPNKVNKQSHVGNFDSSSQGNTNPEKQKRQEFLKKVIR